MEFLNGFGWGMIIGAALMGVTCYLTIIRPAAYCIRDCVLLIEEEDDEELSETEE